ncbi:hypothetical protein [Polyangium sp. y55x31]|uniref:hypothetical protein n=1 Tax=Polyangium sp. y55x31 TaxID=3042688 RepID=UPI00248233D4|nr:hypothetical protein [Polyangium sp. y55x31]MDI1475383.1 hypothetical protein [Polyangium sp. y55x31]
MSISKPRRKRVQQINADEAAGASAEAHARVAELAARWQKVKAWGAAEKLRHTRETQADLERFFAAWEKDPDPSEVVGVTADVRRLELEAEDYDKRRAVAQPYDAQPIGTTFDIERGSTSLEAATAINEGAIVVGAIAKDIAKETSELVEDTATLIPWWVWAGVGVGVVYVGWLGKRAVDKAAAAAAVAAA